MIKTAVILAAGMGTRFGSYTELIPKGFVEYKQKPMVIRSIETLIACGIERIIIGTGYKKEVYEQLKSKFPQIETCFSKKYAETNSMYTLYTVRKLVGDDDFLLLESDLVFESKAITALLGYEKKDAILVSSLTKFQDQYYVECDSNNIMTSCSTDIHTLTCEGEFVGIHKLSNEFYKKMCADYSSIMASNLKMGYEYELIRMSSIISPLYVLKVDGLQWYEIDDEADLKYAEGNLKI